jgi:hypothetical protein
MCSSSRSTSHCGISPDPHHQIFADETSIEACQEGGSARGLSGKNMAPLDVKFPLDTQFTFGSLMFIMGEDGDLKMLPLEAALEHLVLERGSDPCSLANSSTSDNTYSRMDPCAELFLRTVEIIQGIPVVTSIVQPLAGVSSSSSLATSTQLMITPRLGVVDARIAVKRVA